MDSRESPATLHGQALPPHQQPPGMIVGPPPNSYTPSMSNNNSSNHTNMNPMISPNSATMMQNPLFPFNSVAASSSKPLDSVSYGDGSSSPLRTCAFNIEPARKKRGRPRKYSNDGNIALALSPTPVAPISSMGQVDSCGGTPSSEAQAKRNRGRPPGSGKKQLDALGVPGVGFTPHVITVKAGEDVASKIVAFSQQGPRTVCILSANGAICNVTLRQPAMSGGTVTYEGRFEIISLSGSFLLSENNGSRSRTGGLSVSLAGSDGRVLGGGVAGMLIAATPVQVVVGSFVADGKKSKSGGQPSVPPSSNMLNFSASAAAGVSPPSRGGASSDSSDENGNSPMNLGTAPYSNAGGQQMPNMPMYANMGWASSTMNMLPN